MKAEELRERQDEVLGWKINILSYRLDKRFFCTIYDLEIGGRLTHGEGATREEAESSALQRARWAVERSAYRSTLCPNTWPSCWNGHGHLSRRTVAVVEQAAEPLTAADPSLMSNRRRAVDDVICQPLMRPLAMVVGDGLGQPSPEVALACRELVEEFRLRI